MMSINHSSSAMVAYVGLGANLGHAQQQLVEAIETITRLPSTKLIAQSSFYASAPVDAPEGMMSPDYVNAVVCVKTQLTAQQLLDALREIEAQAGRVRSVRNAPRTLDLDVLLYGDEVIYTATLQVPHPRMHERAFVLLPLLEIAPDILLPGLGAAKTFALQVQDQRIQKIIERSGSINP